MECQSTTNGTPTEFKWNANWIPIECQLHTNGMPFDYHRSVTNLPMKCQLMANGVPIDYQLNVNRFPTDSSSQNSSGSEIISRIWDEPIQCQLIANQSLISANAVPIKCQSSARKVFLLFQWPPMQWQCDVNSVPMQCQCSVNWNPWIHGTLSL